MLSADTRKIWRTAKGKKPEFTAKIGGKERDIIAQLEKQTQGIGSRYHLGWDEDENNGHIVTIERIKEGKDGLFIYDPQTNEFLTIGYILEKMQPQSKLELLRVDKLLVNSSLLKPLCEFKP